MRRKLHRPVVGGRWSRRGFGWRSWSWGRDFFGWRDGRRDRGSGGRVLSPGGGARLVLRAAPGAGTMRPQFRSLALRSLRTAPNTTTRHHPPDIPHWPTVCSSTSKSSPRPPSSTRFRGSFNPRQPNVGGKRSRRRRLQQARCNPQRKQHHDDPKERQPSSRPPDPDTHPPLSAGVGDVSPKALERAGTVP